MLRFPSIFLATLLSFAATSALFAAELPPEQPLWPDGFENPIVYDQDETVRQAKVNARLPVRIKSSL